MRMLAYFGCIGLLCLGLSCKENPKTEEEVPRNENDQTEEIKTDSTQPDSKEIVVNLSPKNDSKVSGTITFKTENGSVHLSAEISGLSPGEHAIHIHEKGDCSSADATSTGGHWNPNGQPHGQWGSEEGYHLGDIGNLTADQDGNASLKMTTNKWSIGDNNPNTDILNRAIIIHEGRDDFTSQPTGNAGKRIACGVINE